MPATTLSSPCSVGRTASTWFDGTPWSGTAPLFFSRKRVWDSETQQRHSQGPHWVGKLHCSRGSDMAFWT
eukprot:8207482-Pyramimonas_sp.AAC.1